LVEITKDFIKIIATLIVVLSIFAVVFNSGILENLFALKTYAEPLTLLDHIASTIETASSCPGECSFSVRTSGLPYILQIYKDNGRYYASIDASLVEQKSNVKFLPNEQKPIFIKPLISDCVISEQKLAFTEGLIQDLTIEKVVEGTTCMISIQSKKVYYDFNITVNPDTLLVLNGTSSTTTATVSLIGGSIAPGSVTLTVMGVPPGITITLDKNNANPTFTSTMTVTAEPNAAPGTYNLTIMGTSGNLARTASLQIEVSPVLYTFILNSAISILKLPLTGVEVNLNSITKYTRQYDEFTSNIIYSMIPGTPYSIKAINPFADPKGPRPFSHFRDFDCQGNNTSYILDTNVNPYPFTIPNKYNIVYSRRMTAFYKDLTQIRNLEFDNVTNTISGSLLDEDFNSISKKETSYVACNVSTTVYPNRNVTIEYLDACSNSWKSIGSVASSFAQNRFYDNFDKDHNNWNINSGTWNITNGALNNSGIGYESIQTKWNFWNSSSNGNNNLEVSVNLSSGSNVSIRVFDAFDDYYLQTNDSYNNLYLWVNGALKASVTLTGIVPNQWNTWRIRQNNSYLEFYINNRKLIRFYNAPPIDFGRVQFRTFNTQAYFDNVTIYDGSWSYNFNIPCNVKKIKAAYTSSDWYYNDTYSVIDIDPTSIPCKLIVNTQIDIGKNQQSEPLPGIEVNVSDGVLNKKYTKNTSGPLATAVYFLASTFFPVHNITVNDTFNSRYFSHFYDQDCNPSNANYWLDNASNPYWFSMCRDKNITVQYKTFTDITSSSSSVSSLVPPTTIICDSTCKSQGFISGTCEAGSSTSTGTNLGVIPNDWGNGNPNPSSWIGYGSGNQIVFLDTTVERTPGNPSIWHRYTHIPACSNEAYDSSQSACLSNGGTWNPAGDMNGAREVDGIWYNVSVGDHVVFKCWEKTGLSQNPAYNNDPTDSYGVGARIGMDLYAPNPNRPGYIMIVAGALVNGLGDVNGNVISGHFASAGSDVPCNTSTWTQQVIDYIVPSGYGITQVVGWLQMRPETGDSVQGWFADCELYINPISSNCQSGETSIGQDGCSSGQTCCCSSSSTSKPIGIYTTSWNFGEMDANTLASTFDMSQSWWVEPKDDYSAKMNQVHALNPSYKALVYRNVGSIYDYSTDEWNLANSSGWLLKNTSGDFCRSPTWSSDYLVDFGNPDYQAWVAQKIKSWINQYPFFDGVMCDGGFEQAEIELEWASGTKPVNPRTGNPFTDQEVVDYHAALLNKIIDVVGTSKLFLPNGIWSGNSFSDSGSGSRYRDLLAKVPRLNAIMSEGAWPSMYNTGWYSEQDWLNTIKMVQWIQDNFLKDHFERKFVAFAATDVVPTGATREQLIKFGYCSMMLSIKYFDGRNNLALNSLPDKPDWSSTEPLLQRLHALDLGNPSSDYYNISQTSVYARDFASGKILVNPSTSSYTINLGGSYKTLDGRTVSSITMNAHTGEILTKT
jgi:hypothetical protein